MKQLLFFILVFATASVRAQELKSCCSMPATAQFNLLASNDDFAKAHAEPLPFSFTSGKGRMITYKTADGKTANAFFVQAEKPTNNWIIMVHEWWGLNDYIKQEADKLQGEGVNANVLAVDLYDGNVASTKDDAKKFMGMLTPARGESILKGAIAYAGAKASVYTIGWCMGGGWALQAALLAGTHSAGCVMYYGMPETSIAKLKNLKGDVLGIFAEKDKWITPEVVKKFEADMKEAGKMLIVKSYDADHAFANPSNPNFEKTATEDAHRMTLAFLRQRIK